MWINPEFSGFFFFYLKQIYIIKKDIALQMTYFNRLLELQKNAYANYSNYKVACILIDENSNCYEGVNVENASFGLTICAERSAIACAVSKGCRKIIEAHIICSNKKTFGVPCGMCRQTLAEFMDNDARIILYNINGETKQYLLKDLLPECFRNDYFLKE